MKYFAFVFAICLAMAAPAVADTLLLQNGDRLSGRLLAVDAEAAYIESDYAGELRIPRDALLGVQTDAPVIVTLTGGAEVTGVLTPAPEGFLVQGVGGEALMTLDEVATIHVPDVDWQGAEAAPAEDAPPEEAVADAAAPEEAAPRMWSGAVDAGVTLRRGNTDTTNMSLAAEALREGENNELQLRLAADYAETEDLIDTRRYFGEAKWKVYPAERWYYYLLGSGEKDAGRKLDLRLNAAVGAGRDIIESETRSWSADLGMDYTWERWDPFTPAGRDAARNARRMAGVDSFLGLLNNVAAGNAGFNIDTARAAVDSAQLFFDPLAGEEIQKEDFLSLRLGSTYEQTVFQDSVISDELSMLANLEEFGEYRLTNTLAFTTPLTDVLKLKASLRSEYVSLAEENGAEPWDHTFVTGLRYEF